MFVLHQRTVIQTNDPEDGDRHITQFTLEGMSLPVDPAMPLLIDGRRWIPVGTRSIAIDTKARSITTTITVIEDY